MRLPRGRLAAVLLGALSAAALPPLHAVPVLLIAVPGLLRLIGQARTWRAAAGIGFWFGFGHHVPGLYWITEAILLESARFWWLVPLAVPMLAAVLAGFVAVPCALATRVPPGWRRLSMLAGAWTLADLARQFVFTGFPWNPWGSVWAMPGPVGDIMIQPAAWLGVHGLTLLTLLLAGLPSLAWRHRRTGPVVAVCGVLACWAGSGLLRLEADSQAGPGLTVVMVQGNIPQGRKWDRAFATASFDTHLRLTRAAVAGRTGPTVVIWPETASQFLLETDGDARSAILNATGGAPALVGGVRFGTDDRPRNSLIALTTDGPPVAIYDKWHLVPFGEYVPDWLPLPLQVVPGRGFAPGPGARTLRVPGLPPVGPLICYEAIFPSQILEAGARPDWLANITNDAWFGNSTGPRQHLQAARLRAVETGLPLYRAANTGISAGFDGYGRELGRIGMGREGWLAVALAPALQAPPFSRWGLSIPGGLAAIAIVTAFGGGRTRQIVRRKLTTPG